MQVFPVGKQVAVTIQLNDLDGQPIVPTGVIATVVDEANTVIVNQFTVPFPQGQSAYGSSVEIVVDGPANLLAGGALSGMRIINLSVTTASGAYTFEESYLIKQDSADTLQLLVNSFQTFNQANLLALEIPNLFGWGNPTVTDDIRAGAMIEAYRRITQIGFAVRWPRDPDSQTFLGNTDWIGYNSRIIAPEYWPLMTTEHFLNFFPEEFRTALRRAQIVEADDILAGSPVEDKRRAGILSETIEGSSMMFRSGKPLDLGVSKRAFAYLRGYVQYRATLGRA